MEDLMTQNDNIVKVMPVISPLKSYLQANGKREFDMDTIRELMSYEMFIQLVIKYLYGKK